MSEEGADAGEAPPPVFAGGRPRTRPCAGCKRVRRRCECLEMPVWGPYAWLPAWPPSIDLGPVYAGGAVV